MWSASAMQRIGKREEQQDRWLLDEAAGTYAVFDGLGGHRDGALAASTATAALQNRLDAGDTIADALNKTNDAVLDLDPDSRRMSAYGCPGTTVAGICVPQNTVFWCGDSHVYRLRAGVMDRLTKPHVIWGSRLLACLGMPGDHRSDALPLDPLPGDQYLICSDGLDCLPPEAVERIWRSTNNPQHAVDQLLEAAVAHARYSDNITVVAVAAN